jgi:hypothetical protein
MRFIKYVFRLIDKYEIRKVELYLRVNYRYVTGLLIVFQYGLQTLIHRVVGFEPLTPATLTHMNVASSLRGC